MACILGTEESEKRQKTQLSSCSFLWLKIICFFLQFRNVPSDLKPVGPEDTFDRIQPLEDLLGNFPLRVLSPGTQQWNFVVSGPFFHLRLYPLYPVILSLFKGLFKTSLSEPTAHQLVGKARTVTKANDICTLMEIAVSWRSWQCRGPEARKSLMREKGMSGHMGKRWRGVTLSGPQRLC